MVYPLEVAEEEMELGQTLVCTPCVWPRYEIRRHKIQPRHTSEFAPHHPTSIFALGNLEKIGLGCAVRQGGLKQRSLCPEAGPVWEYVGHFETLWQVYKMNETMSVYLVGGILARFHIGIYHFRLIRACSWCWYVTIAAVFNVGHNQLLRQTDSSRFSDLLESRGPAHQCRSNHTMLHRYVVPFHSCRDKFVSVVCSSRNPQTMTATNTFASLLSAQKCFEECLGQVIKPPKSTITINEIWTTSAVVRIAIRKRHSESSIHQAQTALRSDFPKHLGAGQISFAPSSIPQSLSYLPSSTCCCGRARRSIATSIDHEYRSQIQFP